MRLRPLVLATLLLALSAVPAEAASRLTVRGAGFGHGVGMSQYGALGFAQHGATYRDIVAHYFTGTQIVQARRAEPGARAAAERRLGQGPRASRASSDRGR